MFVGYVLSNGKDQSMKLWDLRMVMPPRTFEHLPASQRSNGSAFDYRWAQYDDELW